MIGKLIRQPTGYTSFCPNPFPPAEGFRWGDEILNKINEASKLLTKLDTIATLLPDTDLFISMYIRKDATFSNQIEGTKATLIDSIEYDSQTESRTSSDVDDIIHYIKAINYSINRLEKFPFSLRFIRELHKVLMENGRASHFSDPGNFRKTQNWIGGTNLNNASFVPPTPGDLISGLNDLEKFIHTQDSINPIIKGGLIHAQFETLHPFLDGNGRTGRILITLYLLHSNSLRTPILYLSTYFKQYQQIYYDRLRDYHNSKIDKWIDFYLDGVIEVAQQAIKTVESVHTLHLSDLELINTLNKTSRESSYKVLIQLYKQPIVKVSTIQNYTGFTRTGAQKTIDKLVKLGILQIRNPEKNYNRSYIHKKYVDIFDD